MQIKVSRYAYPEQIGFEGYVEPDIPSPGWIAFFRADGGALLYKERYSNGECHGDPIELPAGVLDIPRCPGPMVEPLPPKTINLGDISIPPGGLSRLRAACEVEGMDADATPDDFWNALVAIVEGRFASDEHG